MKKKEDTHICLVNKSRIFGTYVAPVLYCELYVVTDSKMSRPLTSWSRVLPEKLTGFQLVKKFPAFYGTRRFITAFTSFRHLSLS